MRQILTVPALVFLVGCSLSEPLTTPDDLERCGPEPAKWRQDQAVQAYIWGIGFKDPGSVQVGRVWVDGPRKWNSLQGSIVGWQISFEANAKNGFGAYTGYKTYQVMAMRGGGFQWRKVMPQ